MIRSIFALSILMNGILVMCVVGILPFFLFLSLVTCGGLVWYSRRLLGQMERVRGDIEGINMLVDSLNTHMASIYQLEMFYGDETLQGLIRHSKDVSFQMSEILERYAVEEEEEGFDNEEEEPVFHEGP